MEGGGAGGLGGGVVDQGAGVGQAAEADGEQDEQDQQRGEQDQFRGRRPALAPGAACRRESAARRAGVRGRLLMRAAGALCPRVFAAFACLFGVRNDAGFRPLAMGPGLLPGLSSALREQWAVMMTVGEMGCAIWVCWADLAAVDFSATPKQFVGRLTWSVKS
ncbi:MAG TPA: hypothetical protein VHF26_01570, partial [Trebonia sp.]|nr:hypothetical protein [Trebonia sp.]